jgi:flagellar biosynthetic protein FlhB
LGGWLFSSEALQPKFSRMNPLSGLKRMFSVQALVELGKAVGKFLVVLTVAVAVLMANQDDLLSIGHEPLPQAIAHSAQIVGWCSLWMACSLILIAAIDVPFQLWDHKQKLMMTKQEVRDEFKDTEGKPEVKSRIRQLQYEMAQRRMLQEVPQADVVITNPTHFAVALKYDADKGGAPRLVAKGGDFLALKIREIAQEHRVELLESPALARAVFYSTELDQEIPAGLYLAVAQVLAYVYQLKQFRAGKGKRPGPLPDLPIPPDLQRDS